MNYTDENRGAIQFRERRKQIIDFSGLRIGNITPTDCDGLIEYHSKAYVLIELKHRDSEVPKGQRITLERATDDWQRAQKTHCLSSPNMTLTTPTLTLTRRLVSSANFTSKADGTRRLSPSRSKRILTALFGSLTEVDQWS